jgi:signal transduction histidine kinase
MDNINTLLCIIILVDLMLVVISLSGQVRNADENFSYLVYLFNVLSIVWWVGSMILNRTSEGVEVLSTTKHLYISATVIASSFYYFSLILHEPHKKYIKDLLGLVFLNIVIIVLVIFGQGVIHSADKGLSGEIYIHFGQYYLLYVLYILILFSTSFARLYSKYRNLKEDCHRGQVFWLFLGYTVSGVVSFVADIIIPYTYGSKYCWVGPVSTIFLATSITYAVTRHKLFNVKVLATEIFVLLLWIFTLVKISAFEQQGNPLTSVIFLLISLTIGILLIKSVKKQAEQHEENKRLVLELANANQQLKEVDDIKSKFVSLARHQMASPLTAINAYASLLNDKDVDLDKIGLKSLQGIIDRFIVIVKDFLAISQIENEEVKYSNDEVDLAQTLNDILCERKFIIDHHNINIEMDIGDEEYKIKGDTAKLNTAIANVLENSIQYSKDSTVLIKLEKKNSKIVLTISDEGVRSLPEISSVLLKKFSPDPFEATIMGNGLGVYVSKRFIEAHGGTFEIKNDGGCQFVILLPQV